MSEPPCPGAFEGGSGMLSEIDRALAVIGAAHCMENVRTSPHLRDRPQSTSINQPLWGHEERFPPPRLIAGCGFRKETIAGMRRHERDAP